MALSQKNPIESLSDYVPRRFGLQFEPPMLILEYLIPSTGKLYHHKMKIRNPDKELHEILDYLQKRHVLYLNHPKIDYYQLEQLVLKLKQKTQKEQKSNSPVSKSRQKFFNINQTNEEENQQEQIKNPKQESKKAEQFKNNSILQEEIKVNSARDIQDLLDLVDSVGSENGKQLEQQFNLKPKPNKEIYPIKPFQNNLPSLKNPKIPQQEETENYEDDYEEYSDDLPEEEGY